MRNVLTCRSHGASWFPQKCELDPEAKDKRIDSKACPAKALRKEPTAKEPCKGAGKRFRLCFLASLPSSL